MEQKSVQMWIADQAALQHLLDDAIKSKFKACRCGLGTSDARKDLQWILEP